MTSEVFRDHVDGALPEDARAALLLADPNVLRLAVLHATGDHELAAIELETTIDGMFSSKTVPEKFHDLIRQKALDLLAGRLPLRVSGPSRAEIFSLIENLLGEQLTPAQTQFAYEELALEDFSRAASWSNPPSAADIARYPVCIVGAGFSGLAMGVQLKRLGIPFRIIERQSEIGGTWVLNKYPACRVDVPSCSYQFKFVKNYPWPNMYATQAENAEYLQHCAEQFGLLDHIELNMEVTSAHWNEDSSRWDITARRADGSVTAWSAAFLVSAAGFFSKPHLPAIAGLETFQGQILTTTGWKADADLSGKRLGLIGNGSSGAQLMPTLAREASHLTVFQRTPQWMAGYEKYFDPVPPETQWLNDNIPYYWNYACLNATYPLTKLRDLFVVDREWKKGGGMVSEANDAFRAMLRQYMEEKLKGRPDLIEKSIPSYAPWGRRVVVDSGWYDALLRDNVDLVTTPISRITPTGVVTGDAREHPLDALIIATGFETTEFLSPVDYRGRDRVSVNDIWSRDGPRGYLSLMMPGFPNFFMIYGAPNGQPAQGVMSSWAEIWSRYVSSAIVMLIEKGKCSMECRLETHDEYNSLLDAEGDKLLWKDEGQGGYYLNAHGRPSANLPFDLDFYLPKVTAPNAEDFKFT